MMKRRIPQSIALVAAAVVSMGALLWAADAGRQTIGLAVSPFGWQRLVVVHVLSSLLLSWAIATLASEAIPVLRSGWLVGMWIVAGAALAWLTLSSGAFIAHAMDADRFGYSVRLLVRVLWPVLLQLPWCLAGVAMAGEMVRARGPASRAALATLALTAALVAPACYLSSLLSQQMPAVVEVVAKPRIFKAKISLRRLCDVGSTQALELVNLDTGQPVRLSPQQALDALDAKQALIADRIKQLRVSDPDTTSALELASLLAALERRAEARQLLEPIAEENPRAAVQLAQLFQEEGDWPQSSRWFETALERAQSNPPQDLGEAAASVELQSRSYDAMAYNAGKMKQFDDAERYYLEALEKLPSQRAYFHHQLSRHYELAGRIVKSDEQRRESARLDPDKDEPVSTVLLLIGLVVAVVVYLLVQDNVM
ncbi:MAG: tetratricopeptide repeat protein [Planctomycetes bacterium]|nr:tetratricopeptide repeat protein [Planctomycetota bacterium]